MRRGEDEKKRGGDEKKARRETKQRPSRVGDTANEAARNKGGKQKRRRVADTEGAAASGKTHRGEQQTRGSNKEKPRMARGVPNRKTQDNQGRDQEHRKN